MNDSLEFNVELNAYNGSLEVLLDLAKSQKVDLEQISITKLADQFHEFITNSQMLSRKRLGRDVFMRGSKSGIKPIYDSKYTLTLFEVLKTYANIVMTKDFQRMNIPRLPVLTTEEGIKRIKEFFGKLTDWKDISELIPNNFKSTKNLKRTGKAGIFAGSLELAKEGNISIKQKELFDNIYIKEKI